MKSELRANNEYIGKRATGDGQMNIQTTHKLHWAIGQIYLRLTMHNS